MLEAKGRRFVLLFLLKENAPATEIINTILKQLYKAFKMLQDVGIANQQKA